MIDNVDDLEGSIHSLQRDNLSASRNRELRLKSIEEKGLFATLISPMIFCNRSVIYVHWRVRETYDNDSRLSERSLLENAAIKALRNEFRPICSSLAADSLACRREKLTRWSSAVYSCIMCTNDKCNSLYNRAKIYMIARLREIVHLWRHSWQISGGLR